MSRAVASAFTTDLAGAVDGAEAIFIAVGTPSRRGDGHADLSYVYDAAREIAGALTGPAVIVTKSTVPVGTGDEVERIVREAAPDKPTWVVSNPEFLREGAAIEDFKHPDRIVIGAEDGAGEGSDARDLSSALPQQGAAPVHVAADGRADQICRQRLPRDQDHLHQRDGGPVRNGRRGRAGRFARHRSRSPDRLQVPPSRARLWRLLLPEGHAGAC